MDTALKVEERGLQRSPLDLIWSRRFLGAVHSELGSYCCSLEHTLSVG